MMKILRGERRRDLERRFLNQSVLRSGAHTNRQNATPLVEAVADRLRKGAEEYGDGAFWSKDCFPEIAEEIMDILGWGSLEYVKRLEADQKAAASGLAHIGADAVELWFKLHAWHRQYGSIANAVDRQIAA